MVNKLNYHCDIQWHKTCSIMVIELKGGDENENGHFKKRLIHRGYCRTRIIHLCRLVAEFFCGRSARTQDCLILDGQCSGNGAALSGGCRLVYDGRNIGNRLRFCRRDITDRLGHCPSDFKLEVKKGAGFSLRTKRSRKECVL